MYRSDRLASGAIEQSTTPPIPTRANSASIRTRPALVSILSIAASVPAMGSMPSRSARASSMYEAYRSPIFFSGSAAFSPAPAQLSMMARTSFSACSASAVKAP